MTLNTPERFAYGMSLFIAPLLYVLSGFFWDGDGQYGIAGGTLLVFGSMFWIVAFAGIFRLLREATPRYAAWGFMLAVYGAACGGASFALQGLLMEMYGVSHESSLQALEAHPLVANLIFWFGGPAFPISLTILGVVLIRTKLVPFWVGLMLFLGGALFPVARIPRIDLVAHVVDLLMLIPAWYLGVTLLGQPTLSTPQGQRTWR